MRYLTGFLIITLLLSIIAVISSHAFKGKVIDAEKKEPVEGAMVVICKAVSLKVLNMEDKI
jgi:hypothetical protein